MRILIVLIVLLSRTTPVLAKPFDFTLWDGLLKKYVDDLGRVNYQALKDKDEATLDRFMAALAAAKLGELGDDKERLAFWINAYNAGVIKQVLAHWPVKSVLKVKEFFTKKSFRFAGEAMSLDDVEHGRVRPLFKDPRAHAVLVCGAKSCPRLVNQAYTGAKLDGALDQQTREFLADSTKNGFAADGSAKLSPILKWYEADFRESAGSVPDFVKKYAPPSAQPALAKPGLKPEFQEYDWKLNDQ